jgi:spore maturation protein CgeB
MIYYIGNFTKIWHEECIAQAFEANGKEVFRRDESSMNAEQIFDDIMSKDVEFVLFVKLKIGGNATELVKKLKEVGIKTVCWLFDPYFGYIREYSVDMQPYFKADYVFTTDGGHQKQFEEHGINHICLRQGIHEPESFMKKSDFEYDIIFVGTENNSYPYRQEVIKFLRDNYNFTWLGRHNADEIRSTALNDLYGKAKLAIDISVYMPNYWSNRFYETLGRGGCLVCNMIEGLDKEFTPFKEVITYTKGDFNQLRRVLNYYLENDEARESIRLNGFNRVHDNYTYKTRCKKLLEHLNIGTKE